MFSGINCDMYATVSTYLFANIVWRVNIAKGWLIFNEQTANDVDRLLV